MRSAPGPAENLVEGRKLFDGRIAEGDCNRSALMPPDVPPRSGMSRTENHVGCPGHTCRLTKLHERPPGRGYEAMDDIMFCRECKVRTCSCLGIHVISGMNISFLALGNLTPERLRVPSETPIKVAR